MSPVSSRYSVMKIKLRHRSLHYRKYRPQIHREHSQIPQNASTVRAPVLAVLEFKCYILRESVNFKIVVVIVKSEDNVSIVNLQQKSESSGGTFLMTFRPISVRAPNHRQGENR